LSFGLESAQVGEASASVEKALVEKKVMVEDLYVWQLSENGSCEQGLYLE